MKKIIFKILCCFFGFSKSYNLLFGEGSKPLHPTVDVWGSVIRGKCSIKEGSKIQKGVELVGIKSIRIGRFTSINGPGTTIYSAVNDIKIGSFCSIARGVDIQEFNHSITRPTSYFILQNVFGKKASDIVSKGPVNIGNDVWIGCQSVILSGVTIGDGAVIAANSVVTTNIPPYAVVGGVPAKVLSFRFPEEIIEKMLEIKWWDWSLERIKRNSDFFETDLTMSSFDKLRD